MEVIKATRVDMIVKKENEKPNSSYHIIMIKDDTALLITAQMSRLLLKRNS